jgi:hypothetical protein
MEPLIITGDEVTPQINFNAQTGYLYMSGVAIPEDVRTMFKPVKDWIQEYAENPQPATELCFYFEYLNTAATKMVFELSDIISAIHGREDCRVKLTWQYTRGDLEMHELGEEIIEEFFCLTEIQAVDEL